MSRLITIAVSTMTLVGLLISTADAVVLSTLDGLDTVAGPMSVTENTVVVEDPSPCQGATWASYVLEDASLPGLAAEVEFELLDATTLRVRLANTSTGVPAGFSNSDQLLTGVSWDFGQAGWGHVGEIVIVGGSVVIGPTSMAVNFDTGAYGAGQDVSGEWGYGNEDGTGALANFISTITAHSTPMGGANLDGPADLDGPQAGLVANPAVVALGGLGAIQNEIIATLTLSGPVSDLSFLCENRVRVEFGSDAAFITTPEPATLVLLMAAGMILAGRRR